MKRLFCICTVVLLAVAAVFSTSCKKETPTDEQEQTQPEEVGGLSIRELLKNNDVAAVIQWTYADDADTDHALFYGSSADYSRSEVIFSINSKSEKRVSNMKKAKNVTVTFDSVSDLSSASTSEPEGITMEILPSDSRFIASVKGFEWDKRYNFSIHYDGNIMKGVLATVDRNREAFAVDLPEWVIKLNDKDAGYNKSKDTYSGTSQDLSEFLFNSFVLNKIINTDPAHPDFADAAAFMAKEGKLQPYAEGDSDLYSLGNGSATPKITPSSRLKKVLEDGGPLVSYVTTYSGVLVKLTQPISVEYPAYDFMHLRYYTFNTEHEENDLIVKFDFEGNDGSVKWWTQDYPAYFTTKGTDNTRISNRRALAQYDVSYINLAELAFNVVDENDEIMDEEAISAAGLSVRFAYTDKELGSKPLPEVDVTSKYKTYDNLWVDNTVFYYRTCEKDFIPMHGSLSIKSGDAEFELPTRFDRPKAAVKYPDVTLDYSTFAVVRWKPFKTPEHPDIEIILDENKVYRVPMLGEWMDNRPNGVSYNVIKDGAWVVGNVKPADAESNPSYGNGYIEGVKAYEAYGIDPDTGLSFEPESGGIPAELKKLASIQMYNNFPHFIYDYTSEVQFLGRIDIPVTCTLVSPWETVQFTYTITVKGIE